MASPTSSGDGKTSPFTGGAGGDKGPPESYHTSRKQQSGMDPDINPMDIPAGGISVFPDLDPKGPDAGNPIGAGSKGAKPPFKGLK